MNTSFYCFFCYQNEWNTHVLYVLFIFRFPTLQTVSVLKYPCLGEINKQPPRPTMTLHTDTTRQPSRHVNDTTHQRHDMLTIRHTNYTTRPINDTIHHRHDTANEMIRQHHDKIHQRHDTPVT